MSVGLVDTWLELASLMGRRDVEADREIARDWRSSLGAGAAGVGYAIAQIARDRHDPTLLATSQRWYRIARRLPPPSRRRHSIAFGSFGVTAARALSEPTTAAMRAQLTAAALAGKRAPAEYMFGLAGHALALLALPRDELTSAALRELDRRLRQRPLPSGIGFAHGALGVVVARLALSRALCAPADPSLVAWLRDHTPTRVLASVRVLGRSWCNGLTGFVFGWCLAATVARDERCREHAIAAAPYLNELVDIANGSLCCGLAGRAYALLAIARLDGREEHVASAARLARLALGLPLSVGGVWKGMPGAVGLAHALQHDPLRARFPFVDVA